VFENPQSQGNACRYLATIRGDNQPRDGLSFYSVEKPLVLPGADGARIAGDFFCQGVITAILYSPFTPFPARVCGLSPGLKANQFLILAANL
jgi:hypothetical protein